MNNDIDMLMEKILICIKNNRKCQFTNVEIDFILNKTTISSQIKTEIQKKTIKLYHLLCNTKNNLPIEFIEYAKNILSIPYMYLNDKDIQEIVLFGLKIKDITNKSIKINDKTLSVDQSKIYELLRNFNVYLKAGTGTGKTFLASNFLIERYRNAINENKKFIFIVPTEILENQIIRELKENNSDIEDYIGNSIIENNVFIGTWEKLVFAINKKEILVEIDTLIIDEAHYLFDNNETRYKFFNFIIKTYINNGKKINKVILITPFQLDFEKIENLFLYQNINFLKIEYNKRNSINKWNFNEFEPLEEKFQNENKYEKMIRSNVDSVICIYTSSKIKAKQRAKELFLDKKLLLEIKEQQAKEIEPKLLKEIKEDFSNKKNWKNFDKYLNFQYMENGICYITSDIPEIIKQKIMDLVKKRYIRIVVATSLIISGVDLPFDMTFMDSNKINKKVMNDNEVVNYFGRAGRLGVFKKAYGAGFSMIKRNQENFAWWKTNKEKIIKKLNEGFIENEIVIEKNKKETSFDESINKFNETQNIKYLYDPRIKFETVEFLEKISFNENDYIEIIKTLYKRKKTKLNFEIDDLIVLIFLIYKINEYENSSILKREIINNFFNFIQKNNLNSFKEICDSFQNFKELENNQIYNPHYKNLIQKFNFYSRYYFNLEKSIRPYIAALYKIENDIKITNSIEKYVDEIKNFGKYHFNNFLNHLYLFINNKEAKYTSFSTIMSIFVIDANFYKFLIKNNFVQKYVSIILKNNNAIKQWKRINDFDVDILNIKNRIKNLNPKTKLWEILCKDNEFIQELENYIEEIQKGDN